MYIFRTNKKLDTSNHYARRLHNIYARLGKTNVETLR